MAMELETLLPGYEDVATVWANSKPAEDFDDSPVPKGKYKCVVASGELKRNVNNKPYYAASFKVIDGEHKDRRVFRNFYLTGEAAPFSMRDLAKLTITSIEMLAHPFPPALEVVVNLDVVVTADDKGTQRNEVRKIERVSATLKQPDPAANAAAEFDNI